MIVAVRNRQRRHPVSVTAIRRLAIRVSDRLKLPHEELSIVLVSDAVMACLNARYHNMAGPTDILTFDYGTLAELLISVDRAVAQARRFRSTRHAELARYVVHGLLHLAGWSDATSAERRRMRAAERRFLRDAHISVFRTALRRNSGNTKHD
ncbi:MAG: rRNA maturation RNase YbeY [Verrucomicrobiae bacterium]|nr:rRNA maturation RNase YbeY [Verrucomicrobiae bacterium]MDW8342902.1 rRNA maturation RNase YbeY [Verrucomicrobiae bacterium]